MVGKWRSKKCCRENKKKGKERCIGKPREDLEEDMEGTRKLKYSIAKKI